MLEKIISPEIFKIKHGFYTKKTTRILSLEERREINKVSDTKFKGNLKIVRQIALQEGLEFRNMHYIKQTHSCKIYTVRNKITSNIDQADGLVSKIPNTSICIFSADCAPILLADEKEKVIGAAHAGWRGALNGVIKNVVNEMIYMGAKRENIVAVVGPCISQEHYEVQYDFFKTFLNENSQNDSFFLKNRSGKIFFDLPNYVLKKLQIETLKKTLWTGQCTYSDEKRFYSFRRASHSREELTERLVSIISLEL